jgi:hypothetical protein
MVGFLDLVNIQYGGDCTDHLFIFLKKYDKEENRLLFSLIL